MAAEQVERVFVIADLSGYTALTEAHGNLHAAEAVTRYTEIAQAVLDPGVRLVERVGDEVLLAAEDAGSAVRTLLSLRDAVEREPLFPILCTERVSALATDLEDVAYAPLGLAQFKNIVEPVAIFEVVLGSRSSESRVIDPVCRMQVSAETAPARLPFGGQTFYFCSFQCARTFAERPDRYYRAALGCILVRRRGPGIATLRRMEAFAIGRSAVCSALR